MKVHSSWNPEVAKRILGPGEHPYILGVVLLTLLQHQANEIGEGCFFWGSGLEHHRFNGP